MPNDTTGRHCDYCNPSGECAKLTLRYTCCSCERRASGHEIPSGEPAQ